MKVIFSRKGCDSTAGGSPNLIFPDGTLFSIPIPSAKDNFFYSDLPFRYEGEPIQSILNDLSGKSICHNKRWIPCDYSEQVQRCHYDPMPFQTDVFKGIALGQANRAESHLRKQGVGNGDIFLFYGWFKSIEKQNGAWRYAEGKPDIHLIWSYMRVGDCITLDSDEQRTEALRKYPFLARHPHLYERDGMKNRIYLSEQHQYFPYDENHCLTDLQCYKGRSTWRLPSFFHQPQAFSFLKNFSLKNDDVVISYRGYGQEFVLNRDHVKSSEDRSLILDYVDSLIR